MNQVMPSSNLGHSDRAIMVFDLNLFRNDVGRRIKRRGGIKDTNAADHLVFMTGLGAEGGAQTPLTEFTPPPLHVDKIIGVSLTTDVWAWA